MSKISFNHKNSQIEEREIDEALSRIDSEREKLREVLKEMSYSDERCFVNLPFDKKLQEEIKSVADEKKKLGISRVFVIGIGGSLHGSRGIYEFLRNSNSEEELVFVNDIQCRLLQNKLKILARTIEKGENVIINCISKSGRTMETIANFRILLDFLKKKKNDYKKYVVITASESSELYRIAERKGFSALKIPEKLTGRYSVFSAVGIFPLTMSRVSEEKLLEGARFATKEALEKRKSVSSLHAAVLYKHYLKGKKIHVLFSFEENLEELAKWYLQLYAESLGKEGRGIMPVFSRATQDLHYFAQLYLDGEGDKITSFFKISDEKSKEMEACSKLSVPEIEEIKELSTLVENISGRNLREIMLAIYGGVKKAYEKRKLPFMEYLLEERSEKAIAEFMQHKLIEVAFLGNLLEVNPFNQPAVEEYKSEARRILKEKESRKHG